MLVKNKLTESFIIQGKIDKVSSVDTRLIKNHILSNFTLTNRYDDSQYWYMKDYVQERRDICNACEHKKIIIGARMCEKCGCSIWAKTMIPMMKCPVGKWHAR